MRFLHALKRAVIVCVRSFLALFYFLPVHDGRILLSSYVGEQYSGNVRRMSEYLLAHYGEEVELIWEFRHPEKFRDIPGIKTVRYYSPAWFYYALTSSVFLTNMGLTRIYPKRKEQLAMNTWHGGGAYKRIGLDRFQLSQAERRSRLQAVDRIDICLSSSDYFSHFALREDKGYTGEILNCGMPRNDIFFSAEQRQRAAEKVRRALGLSGYVALYAPTFRGEQWRGYQMDFHFPYAAALDALRQRIGGPVTILRRAHLGCKMADSAPEEVVDVSAYPDMQELLCAVDMLVTDYSSCMWDYALLGRPCLLYVTDLAEYERERGICTPVEQWPGIACRSDEELLDAIRTLDERSCAEKAREHLRTFGSYETGTATKQACERVMEHIRNRRAAG